MDDKTLSLYNNNNNKLVWS